MNNSDRIVDTNNNASDKLKDVISQNDVDLNLHRSNDSMLWNPKESQIISHTNALKQFQDLIEQKYSLVFGNYDNFLKWSVDKFTLFWEEFWHFSKIIHSKPYDHVLADFNRPMDSFPFQWFDGALMNYAENILSRNDSSIAVYSYGEAFTQIKTISFSELRERVRKYQVALKKLGVVKGDCVVGYLPNIIEALEAKLATVSLGALWSCASPDFGPLSVTQRFEQIRPKIIFSVRSVIYNGKFHDHKSKLTQVINSISSIEHVVLVPFNPKNQILNETSDDDIPKRITLEEFLALDDETDHKLCFEQVPFTHPLVILFSSGTTGVPKCIVHSHGGTLIQHLKEHLLMSNMSKNDTIFYYTTTGWMMYNWLVTSLAIGASIVLYDGSPVLPNINVLWDLVDKIGITMFGTSAKWISVIEDQKCVPKNTNKLDSLKIIFSTGSPLKPSSFDYVYRSIKSDVLLGSITGGSDIISLFCGNNVQLPVYRGEIQCRGLGMAVECWNENGEPVYDQCGELVCVKPFPSMPVYFANDPDYKKYKSSYFDKFPGVWAHGDFCMISKQTGGVLMFGRSDGTLNPNGVRFGSAEIYSSVEGIEELDDSLCVGQKNPNNLDEERVILFVKLRDKLQLDKNLIDKIKSKIRLMLSPRHVPSLILQINEIPYTLNGKKVEVPVRRIIEGVNITASSSLTNPQSLEQFRHLECLQKW